MFYKLEMGSEILKHIKCTSIIYGTWRMQVEYD